MNRLLAVIVATSALLAACSPEEKHEPEAATADETRTAAQTAIDEGHAAEHSDDHPPMTATHWSYTGPGGPDHWGDLKEEYATCRTGTHQSPIDVDTSAVSSDELPPITFHYQDAPLVLVNNGHTIQANFPPGSSIDVGGQTYQLLQFHFHTPSEHTIDGQAFPMVAHLVHQNADGGLGVVGVLMREGAAHPGIQAMWDAMPTEADQQAAPDGITINAADLLPEDRSYYSYSGSLTTPPCSEGVAWMVLKNPIEVSPEQVAAMVALFGNNARPVQELHGRMVTGH